MGRTLQAADRFSGGSGRSKGRLRAGLPALQANSFQRVSPLRGGRAKRRSALGAACMASRAIAYARGPRLPSGDAQKPNLPASATAIWVSGWSSRCRQSILRAHSRLDCGGNRRGSTPSLGEFLLARGVARGTCRTAAGRRDRPLLRLRAAGEGRGRGGNRCPHGCRTVRRREHRRRMPRRSVAAPPGGQRESGNTGSNANAVLPTQAQELTAAQPPGGLGEWERPAKTAKPAGPGDVSRLPGCRRRSFLCRHFLNRHTGVRFPGIGGPAAVYQGSKLNDDLIQGS